MLKERSTEFVADCSTSYIVNMFCVDYQCFIVNKVLTFSGSDPSRICFVYGILFSKLGRLLCTYQNSIISDL